jgi:hypothetical protein
MFNAESVFRKQKLFRLLMLSKLDETTVLNLRLLRMSLPARSFIHDLEADGMGCGSHKAVVVVIVVVVSSAVGL